MNDKTRHAGRKLSLINDPKNTIGKTHFIGIAIDEYRYLPNLKNAVRDVETLVKLLIDKYALDPSNVLIIKNEQASQENIIRHFYQLADTVKAPDSLLIYFAGHGHVDRHGGGFWVPVDANQDQIHLYIPNSVIRDHIGYIQSLHTFLICDACFSGSLLVRGDNHGNQLAAEELASLPSRWVLCSGRQNEVVFDGPPGGHSPFAESILDVLGKSDRSFITVGFLVSQVIEQTRANYKQLPDGRPLENVGNKRGQYVFWKKTFSVQPYLGQSNEWGQSISLAIKQYAILGKQIGVDNLLDYRNYKRPILNILPECIDGYPIDKLWLEECKDIIIETLLHYELEVIKIRASVGPNITFYAAIFPSKAQMNKVQKVHDDLAFDMCHRIGREVIVKLVPEKKMITFDIPNSHRLPLCLKKMVEFIVNVTSKDFLVGLGTSFENKLVVKGLPSLEHILFAGETEGVISSIQSVLISLLFQTYPHSLKFALIDTRRIEFFPLGQIGDQFLCNISAHDEPIVSDSDLAVTTLNSLCLEMHIRFELIENHKQASFSEYNDMAKESKAKIPLLPVIVVVINELADLMLAKEKEVEDPIVHLLTSAHKVGIHLLLGTRLPNELVVSEALKNKIKSYLVFKTNNEEDSVNIIGNNWANKLLGDGDAIAKIDGILTRIQTVFPVEEDFQKIVEFIGKQQVNQRRYILPPVKRSHKGK